MKHIAKNSPRPCERQRFKSNSKTKFVIPAKARMTIGLVLVLSIFLFSPAHAQDGGKESAFERVMRTGTIRCGYWVGPPLVTRDPNTGTLSGAYVDYVEELGRALSLKIEWAGEINLSTYLQDLNQGKFDLECATGWPNALRGKQVEYANPIGFLPMHIYTRAGDARFDKDVTAINNPAIKFAAHDGGSNALIQQAFFPNATLLGIPGDMPGAEPLEMVRHGKADVAAHTTFEGQAYLAANPGSIRMVPSAPLRIIPISMSVAAGEFRFLSMLNTATNQLLYDGTIDRLYDKYGLDETTVLRVAKPYEVQK